MAILSMMTLIAFLDSEVSTSGLKVAYLESSHFHNFKYIIFSSLGDSLQSKKVAKGQLALRDWSIFKYSRSSLSVGFQEIDPVHFRLDLLCCI
jgi:hypothetical protein